MKPLIRLREVLISKGSDFHLSIDHLDLLPQRIYAVTGPNGAGKSTLLRLLAFLTPPEQGLVQFADGKGRLREQRQKITLVEQTPYLLHGSVADNLSYGLKLRGIKEPELQKRIQSALSMVGLPDFALRRADKLSGGEAQRVALARAIALQPELLLLDEPTSNIDHKNLLAFEKLLSKLPEYGITVIFATHDLTQPDRLGAETICLENGRLLRLPQDKAA